MNAPLSLQPAAPWRRAMAYLVDLLVFYFALFAAMFVSLLIWVSTGGDQQAFMDIAAVNGAKVVVFALRGAYFFVFEALSGATLGKRLLGCRVVSLSGGRASAWQALFRNVGSLVNWLTLGLGFVSIVLRKDRRGLHDILAGTRVVMR